MNIPEDVSFYLRADCSMTFLHTVAYREVAKNNTCLMIGAYFGYCGGGEYESGCFVLNAFATSSELFSHDEASNSQHWDLFSDLLHMCGSMSCDDRPFQCTPAALKLLEGSKNEDDDLIYATNNFDGDSLTEVSCIWNISLRFLS